MGLCNQQNLSADVKSQWNSLSDESRQQLEIEFRKRSGIDPDQLNQNLDNSKILFLIEKVMDLQCEQNESAGIDSLLENIKSLLGNSSEIRSVSPRDSTLGTQDDHSSAMK